MKIEKTVFALCNSKLEPVMYFSDKSQLDDWLIKQTKLHGSVPNCIPCQIITTVETKEIT